MVETMGDGLAVSKVGERVLKTDVNEAVSSV